MKKLLSPFIFLALIYLYTFHSNDISLFHKPIVAIFLYVTAIIVCALLLVNVKKERSSNNSN